MTYTHLNDKINIQFCWVLGHAGIPGNKAAKEAARRQEMIPIYYKDWDAVIRKRIEGKWKTRWVAANNKMSEILTELGELQRIKGMARREEVIMNRLRADHCSLTHE